MENKLNKNKKFESPDLIIILFTQDDIITESGDFGEGTSQSGDDWHNGGF